MTAGNSVVAVKLRSRWASSNGYMKIHRLRAAGLDLNLRVYLTSPVLHQISDDPAMTRWIECAIDTALAAMEIEVKTARNLHWNIAARCLLPFMGTEGGPSSPLTGGFHT